MSVITRDMINKDIIFEDRNLDNHRSYNFQELSKQIDLFKNIFLEYGAEKGQSVLIGFRPGIDQIASIYACLELGLSITIADYGRADNFRQYKYMDPKTNILMPIDFFILSNKQDTDKFNFFSQCCKQTIIFNKLKNKNNEKNDEIRCEPDTVIMKCTSSGTTGTPKKITHTHDFFCSLVKRNSMFFDNTVGLKYNLNHGSSFATYFLPALYSKDVKKFVNIPTTKTYNDIDHLMLVYRHHLEEIKKINNKEATYYTLSTIPIHLKEYNHCYKNIISFFGTNETSGPVLINQINDERYTENSYFKIDDFYNLTLNENKLNISVPVYNSLNKTDDRFHLEKEVFYFQGRSGLYRINGRNINIEKYRRIVSKRVDADLVFDFAIQKIYLAVWDSNADIDGIKRKINEKLISSSKGAHFIEKVKILDKTEFFTGVKIDQELLRVYFRTYV